MNAISNAGFIHNVLANMPPAWINLTTHRLDIYDETQAKTDFLNHFSKLETQANSQLEQALSDLPTAFDYIRLGHPLSCVLEWFLARALNVQLNNVITFSSKVMPILAILRRNALIGKRTQICYTNSLTVELDKNIVESVYGYTFELKKINSIDEITEFNGSTLYLNDFDQLLATDLVDSADFIINIHPQFGSITIVNCDDADGYIDEIQHVRRRESIAMTPSDCKKILTELTSQTANTENFNTLASQQSTIETIQRITNTTSSVCLASSGLSIQYAIVMGLIDHALHTFANKKIKLIVPPNCYGGTNDQARRVAQCSKNIDVLDLPVDGGQDMAHSLEQVLTQVALEDCVPFIIAEIPTNPRVEVPDLELLQATLVKQRKTAKGDLAIAPTFILDQTFCPNVKFLGDHDLLKDVKAIAYVSGSKFPSGGICTAGYCVANTMANELMSYIHQHLELCDNTATGFQIQTLSEQMPSMNKRIEDAYKNTRDFVNFIQETLPSANINFVSDDIANAGFTPSVFSLDLPTKGSDDIEREEFKRALNLKLINMMINDIPNESKHCVSYGQLTGCYWTIPATSTQGTTQEGDKDYIVRVAVAPDFDLVKHQNVFKKFCDEHITFL